MVRTLAPHIFLIDGLGAVVSGLATCVVLPLFASSIGLPVSALWLLAAPAAVFAVYSLSCWRLGASLRSDRGWC